MISTKEAFIDAKEVSQVLGVGMTKAYEVVKKYNAELDAMGYYTMLAEPSTPHMAIDKVTARRNKVQLNKEYGNTIVEIWKYSPSLLSGNGVVDRLSLYLCMKDNSDERIQIESDTLIDDMKW